MLKDDIEFVTVSHVHWDTLYYKEDSYDYIIKVIITLAV